ncbi:uncharacterized protein [Ptychodera flava]|uniref:uncharacterized protein n=1 Tax=Ptychodera flava TaxID=63121 RepID=UPI00396A6AC0
MTDIRLFLVLTIASFATSAVLQGAPDYYRHVRIANDGLQRLARFREKRDVGEIFDRIIDEMQEIYGKLETYLDGEEATEAILQDVSSWPANYTNTSSEVIKMGNDMTMVKNTTVVKITIDNSTGVAVFTTTGLMNDNGEVDFDADIDLDDLDTDNDDDDDSSLDFLSSDSSDWMDDKEECEFDDDCAEDEFCDNEDFWFWPNECSDCFQADELCNRNAECCKGSLCVWGRCQPDTVAGDEGTLCEVDTDCFENMCCAYEIGLQTSVCQPMSIEGEECSGAKDTFFSNIVGVPASGCPCATGLQCLPETGFFSSTYCRRVEKEGAENLVEKFKTIDENQGYYQDNAVRDDYGTDAMVYPQIIVDTVENGATDVDNYQATVENLEDIIQNGEQNDMIDIELANVEDDDADIDKDDIGLLKELENYRENGETLDEILQEGNYPVEDTFDEEFGVTGEDVADSSSDEDEWFDDDDNDFEEELEGILDEDDDTAADDDVEDDDTAAEILDNTVDWYPETGYPEAVPEGDENAIAVENIGEYKTPGEVAVENLGEYQTPGEVAVENLGQYQSPGEVAVENIGQYQTPGEVAVENIGQYQTPGEVAVENIGQYQTPGEVAVENIGQYQSPGETAVENIGQYQTPGDTVSAEVVEPVNQYGTYQENLGEYQQRPIENTNPVSANQYNTYQDNIGEYQTPGDEPAAELENPVNPYETSQDELEPIESSKPLSDNQYNPYQDNVGEYQQLGENINRPQEVPISPYGTYQVSPEEKEDFGAIQNEVPVANPYADAKVGPDNEVIDSPYGNYQENLGEYKAPFDNGPNVESEEVSNEKLLDNYQVGENIIESTDGGQDNMQTNEVLFTGQQEPENPYAPAAVETGFQTLNTGVTDENEDDETYIYQGPLRTDGVSLDEAAANIMMK